MVEIRDRDRLAGTPARETALSCVAAGIDAAMPGPAVRDAVSLDGDALAVGGESFDLADRDRVLVVGGGKAGAEMVRALAEVLGDRIDEGVVVTDAAGDGREREGGSGESREDGDPLVDDRIEVVPASHPVPDRRGIDGARSVLDLADGADERDLVIVVLSGGGSALLPAPADGIDLAALRETTDALLDSGAAIDEVNAVRKHCSAIKGGRLARRASPATLATLAISDVVGDDPAVIASGPTAPDPTTYADARAVLERYGIDPPRSVADHLAAGARGDRPETPGPGDPAFEGTSYHVLADARTAVTAARDIASERGYEALVLSSRVRGEAAEAAKTHAAVAEEVRREGEPVEPPAVVVSGGETTVTVTGQGEGGPNAEFALSAAREFAAGPEGSIGEDVALVSVDTDGRDGPGDADGGGGSADGRGGDDGNDARADDGARRAGEGNLPPAGAVVDAHTVPDPPAAARALADDDAHGYLADRNALVVTGPTGTNVNDLRVLVVESAGEGG